MDEATTGKRWGTAKKEETHDQDGEHLYSEEGGDISEIWISLMPSEITEELIRML